MKKIIIPALLVLTGCTKTVAEMNYSERQALVEQIKARCVEQGTTPGTPQYGACLKAEAQSEVATRERRARVQDARRASNAVCTSFGNTMVCN